MKLTAGDLRSAAELVGKLPRGPRLALAPGAGARWPNKALPADLAVRLLLAAASPERSVGWSSLLLVGGPDDLDLMRRIGDDRRLKGVDGLSLVPPTRQLGAYAAVLASCDRVICADSLPLHLARAVGTRAVAFFGPTSLHEIDPGKDVIRLLPAKVRDWDCLPCFKSSCRRDEFCLDQVSEAELRRAVGGAPRQARHEASVKAHAGAGLFNFGG